MNGIEAKLLRDPFRDDLDHPICRAGGIFGRKEKEIALALGKHWELALVDQMRIGDDLRIHSLPKNGAQSCDGCDTAVDQVAQRIASLCKLDWFTTEIALTHEEFVVVDYVNDQIDTRVQSKAVDGAPDDIMRNIAWQLVTIAKANQ